MKHLISLLTGQLGLKFLSSLNWRNNGSVFVTYAFGCSVDFIEFYQLPKCCINKYNIFAFPEKADSCCKNVSHITVKYAG